MTFDPDDPRLTAFALGELDEADRAAVESLLATSPEASRFVAEVRQTARILAESLRLEPSPGLSIVQRLDLEDRLLGGPAGAGPRPEPSGVSRLPIRRAMAALAAGLLLAAGGFGVGRLSHHSAAPGRTGSVAESAAAPSPSSPAPTTELAFADQAMPAIEAASEDAGPDRLDESAEALVAAEPSPPASEAAPPALARSMRDAPAAAPETPLAAAPSPSRAAGEAPTVASRASSDRGAGGPGFAGGLAPEGRAEPGEIARKVAPPPGDAPAELLDEPSMAEDTFGLQNQPQAGQAGYGLAEGAMGRPPAQQRRQAMGGMAGGMGGMGMGMGLAQAPEPEVAFDRLSLGVEPMPGSIGGRALAAKVEGGNVVEVIELANGAVRNRIALPMPVREVELDATGSQLLATGADKSMSVYHVESGRLLNALRFDREPLPEARFGPGGEVILSKLGDGIVEAGGASGPAWRSPATDPVAVLPVDPGAVPLDEVGRWLDPGLVPIGRGVPLARLVNAPPYPGPEAEAEGVGDDGDAVSVDARVVPAPWDRGNRLVRIALIARPVGDDEDPEAPPVVADGVSAEVAFNPARVSSYRPIGFEGRPSPAPVGEGPGLRAGDRATLLIEVEPTEDGRRALGAPLASRSRYFAADPATRDELLAISLSYGEPGREGRRTVEVPVPDAPEALDEAPEDVRLASAMAWFGMALAGAVPDVPGALDGASALVGALGEDVLPEYRLPLLGLIDRARSLAGAGADGAPR